MPETVRRGDRELRGVVEPQLEERAVAVHLQDGDERVPVRDRAPAGIGVQVDAGQAEGRRNQRRGRLLTSRSAGCRVSKARAPDGRPSSIADQPARFSSACRHGTTTSLRLFAEALTTKNPASALGEIARAHGQFLGARAWHPQARKLSARRQLERVATVLAEYGYEPAVTSRQATLRNCPFDALSRDYRPVVCPMNRALIDGLISGLGIDGITTEEQHRAGQCCVVLTRRADAGS